MKKLLIILHFSFFVFHYSFAQHYGWVDLSANIPDHDSIFNTLRDVRFIGQEGWIAASLNEAKIYHTTDGGQTFTIQSLPVNSGGACQSLHMRNNLEGYAVTNAGHILQTQDGGNNWTTIGTGMGLLYSVSFPPVPEPSGYACSGNGSVYKITESIVTQDYHINGATLHSIVFPVSSDEGWVCGGTVIRRRNSGGWQIGDQNYNTSVYYTAIYFIDNQHGWAVGVPSSGIGTIIYTLNGTDWFSVQNIPDANQLNDVFFINSQEGWAVGENVFLHSTNGGLNWVQEATAFLDATSLMSVFAVSSHEVYVVGNRANKSLFLKYTLITGTEENPEQVNSILYQNQPNPFRESTIISWQIPAYSPVVLKVFDFMGKEIRTLVDAEMAPGEHRVVFDATGLPVGVYFYQLSLNGRIETKKMILSP